MKTRKGSEVREFLRGVARRLALSLLIMMPAAGASGAEKDIVPDARLQDSPLAWQEHTGGLVRTLITNFGQVGSTPGTSLPWSELPSLQWPGLSHVEYLYVGGWWFGALVEGTPRVTTAAYGLEFRPGESVGGGIHQTREGDLGGKRFPAADADDDADGQIDEDWPDGLDNDADGRVDEDFAAISDQMLASIFADTSASIPLGSPGHVPLGLQVQQAALAWSRPELDDFVGFDLLLTNISSDTLMDAFVGFFADCDIGSDLNENRSVDDRAGFWEGNVLTTFEGSARDVDLSVGTMFDGDGDSGQTPGVVGFVFLGAEPAVSGDPRFDLRNFRMFTGSSSYSLGGDPTNDVQRYSCLDGTAPLSLAAPGPTPRPEATAAFDSDWRVLVSMGPFARIAPGDSLRIAMAMVMGQGFDDMLANAARAKLLYQGVEVDCDGDGQTPEVCPAHWTTPHTVSTGLQDFQIISTPEARSLTWRLDAATQRQLRGIGVERSAWSEGPFESRTPVLLAPTISQYRDVVTPEEHAQGRGDVGAMLWYRLALHFQNGVVSYSAPLSAAGSARAATTTLAVPRLLDHEAVQIEFSLAAPGPVRLSIHDVNGRLVRSWIPGSLEAGVHRITWDRRSTSGRLMPRGIYLVRLEAASTATTRKFLVVEP